MPKAGVFGALALLLAAAAGCGSEEEMGAPGRPRVALVMKSLANEFFKTMEEGARNYHSGRGEQFDLIVTGIKNEEDIGGQITLVEQTMTQRVDAIVIAPADSKALVPVLARALEAGIAVVNIDNKLDDAVLAQAGIQVPFVGPDNRKGARLAGEYLAGRLHAGDAVAVLEGIPSAFNGIERRRGFEEAMAAGGIEIVASQSANWETDQAVDIVGAMINAHPEIKAILAANDSMALGALAAIKAAGKADEVFIVGYDAISAVRALVASGEILCTIDQHADRLAVFGIEYALEILRESAIPEDRETPVDLVTAQDAAP